jgi:hypothetical protein
MNSVTPHCTLIYLGKLLDTEIKPAAQEARQ